MIKIQWRRKAIKQLAKLAKPIQPEITRAVSSLIDYKKSRHVKKLVNYPYQYRLRVRNYRVLFDVINDEIEIILIQEVKKRDDHTY